MLIIRQLDYICQNKDCGRWGNRVEIFHKKLGNGIFSYRLSFQVYWNEMMTNGIKKKKATASIFCQQLPFLLYMENLISSKMKNIAY